MSTKKLQDGGDGSAAPEVCIVGGAGHVGLPLALVLADRGMRVKLLDFNAAALQGLREGRMPFHDRGAEPMLQRALAAGRLSFCTDAAGVAGVPIVVVTIATPVNEYQNPDFKIIKAWADEVLPHLGADQLILLRSTVYPGTTEWLDRYFRQAGKSVHVAYCPERIAQGQAIEELQKLPQLVSGTTPEAERRAVEFSRRFAPHVELLTPMEAEFAKLFCNTYRYIKFAIANQFYMICESAGIDFNRIVDAVSRDYARAGGFPTAGFTAGPCLLKDTMQLAAFARNNFPLGNAAILVNEGLVLHLVERMAQRHDLAAMTVGLLGVAFKPDCDDARASLTYKLKNTLITRAKAVLCTDPHVRTDPNLLPLDEVIRRSDVLVLCVPHTAYRGLDTHGKPIFDVWGFIDKHGAHVDTPVAPPPHPIAGRA